MVALIYDLFTVQCSTMFKADTQRVDLIPYNPLKYKPLPSLKENGVKKLSKSVQK